MKITQPVTSLCIITFQKSFVDLKSTQNITLKYLGLYVSVYEMKNQKFKISKFVKKWLSLIRNKYF